MTDTELTRMRHRASTDRSVLDVLLDRAQIGHFALIVRGRAVVLPTAIARDGDVVLTHGSTGSPWLRALAAGAETSLAVTVLDGLVVARSAFESSMNYRSAVLFGQCTVIDQPVAKLRALDVLTEAMIPGRTAELRRPTGKEMAATVVLSLPIERWSLKVSDHWPEDGDDDVAGSAWAGVLPALSGFGSPIGAPNLRAGIAVPDSALRLASSTKSALGPSGAPVAHERQRLSVDGQISDQVTT